MKQRILLFLTGMLCTAFIASAQSTVNGSVVDTQGEPVVGAAVFVEGNQSVGTLTDLDGNFTLKNVPDKPATSWPPAWAIRTSASRNRR